MMKKLQNHYKTLNIKINGQDPEEYEASVSHAGALQTAWNATAGKFTAYIALQAQMAVFDALHGTNYRRTRNKLYREQREAEKRARFEAKIGLIRAC